MLFHIPGEEGGYVNDQYTGQVDLLPTLLHLLGIETDQYLFMGQDMFSPEHDNLVTMRNGRFINEDYTIISGQIFDTQSGDLLNDQLSESEIEDIFEMRDEANQQLEHSDNILMKDLLRFYTPESLSGLEPNDYIYYDQMEILENHPNRDTSLVGQSERETFTDLYETNAPEITGEPIISEFNQYGQEASDPYLEDQADDAEPREETEEDSEEIEDDQASD